MKIIGLTRIRNEAAIIRDTLDHMATFCDTVIVFDDASSDKTVRICNEHSIVSTIILNTRWDKDRARAEWQNRGELLAAGKKVATMADWFVYMDADERIEFDFSMLETLSYDVIGIRMKLFDYYITPSDYTRDYNARKFLGPEYRNILMAFRNLPTLDYSSPDQREVHLRTDGIILDRGHVKHFGKAISIKQWEDTCNYYATYFPKYSAKWNARRGKAIHTRSSFGHELILWHEKEEKGFPLTKQIEKNNIYANPGY